MFFLCPHLIYPITTLISMSYHAPVPAPSFLLCHLGPLKKKKKSNLLLSVFSPGRRTLPEALSSSSQMAWWWHRCQRRSSATRSCQTLCLTQNTWRVWNHIPYCPLLAHACTAVFYHWLLQIQICPKLSAFESLIISVTRCLRSQGVWTAMVTFRPSFTMRWLVTELNSKLWRKLTTF